MSENSSVGVEKKYTIISTEEVKKLMLCESLRNTMSSIFDS